MEEGAQSETQKRSVRGVWGRRPSRWVSEQVDRGVALERPQVRKEDVSLRDSRLGLAGRLLHPAATFARRPVLKVPSRSLVDHASPTSDP